MELLLVIVFVGLVVIIAALGFVIFLLWRVISNQKKQIKAQNKKRQKTKTIHQIDVSAETDTPQNKLQDGPDQEENTLSPDKSSTEKIPYTSDEIEITPEFQSALDLLEGDAPCIYVTGKAGTGKSTLLKYFVEHTNKSVALLAPTGMAALQIEGQTLHSFFGFPARTLADEDIKQSNRPELYRAVDTIIIDEISMVRADLLDRIDQFLMLNGREMSKPFGGVQMIFFGDLYQLPPIVSEEEESQYISVNYDSPYFFDANVMKRIPFTMIELNKVFRQTELEFITALDQIRINDNTALALGTINQRCVNASQLGDEGYITLTATNAVANQINRTKLEKIPSPIFTYEGRLEGEFKEQKRKKVCPPIISLN